MTAQTNPELLQDGALRQELKRSVLPPTILYVQTMMARGTAKRRAAPEAATTATPAPAIDD